MSRFPFSIPRGVGYPLVHHHVFRIKVALLCERTVGIFAGDDDAKWPFITGVGLGEIVFQSIQRNPLSGIDTPCPP
jgi:hypothetical protein